MTKIERLAKGIYWDRSWNPFTGCSPFPEGSTVVREGCRNCWAKRMAHRLKGRHGYPADEPFRPTFHPERLSQLNSKQKPQVIALCFMSDPFHEGDDLTAKWQMLNRVIQCKQHSFIALTKRPVEMRHILGCYDRPIPNLVGGVSVWDQESADRMIPVLLQTNLAARIISLEPCLGPVDFEPYLPLLVNTVDGPREYNSSRMIDGIILGGESGPGARPMHPDIPRSVRDQCQAANIPFLFKQWGEWAPGYNRDKLNCCISNHHSPNLETARYQKKKGQYLLDDPICMEPDRGAYGAHSHPYREQCEMMTRVGKKAAGRLLDGRTWDELPEVMV